MINVFLSSINHMFQPLPDVIFCILIYIQQHSMIECNNPTPKPINKFIKFEMDNPSLSRPYYTTSQSTILPSAYPPSKQLPTFSGNPQIQNTYPYQPYSTSNYNTSSTNPKQDPYFNHYSNQYYQSAPGETTSSLSRSAIFDKPSLTSTNSSKLDQMYNNGQKKYNLNKYANMSTSKLEQYKLQEQLEDAKEEGSPGNTQKMSQNISFQFSPKKMKKVQEQSFVKQGSGEWEKDVEKNNLSNYKRVELFNPNRDKRSISNQVSGGNLKFNFVAHTNSNTESPNNSTEQNKLLKREFSSSEKFGNNDVRKTQSPMNSVQVNYFANHNQKKAPTTASFASPKSYHNNSGKSNHHNFAKDDFVVIRKLGKGKYGDVSLTYNRHIGFVCALKSISKETILSDQGGVNQFIRQVTIQMFLSHQHIVECWGLFCDQQNVYLIMEPALDGQLFKYMKQKRQLSEVQTAGLVKQLCLGVEYLQSEKIIHRDLKPQNILLHEGKLKIGDFGWAVYNENSFRETFCGTPLYLSPDVLKGDQYNDKVDNWAIGIITYEMLVGRIPFKITQESEMEKIITQEIQFPSYVNISDYAKDFILRLLERDPDTRMDIEAILMHKFLSIS